MKQTKTVPKATEVTDKRTHTRRDIGSYPVNVTMSDGTKVRAFVSNISFDGMQIKCNRLSAHILSPKSGFLTIEDAPDVEIALILPFKKGIRKIDANYKIKYTALAKDTDPEFAFVVGLQVMAYKGRSFQTLKELLEGHDLPNLQSNLTHAASL